MSVRWPTVGAHFLIGKKTICVFSNKKMTPHSLILIFRVLLYIPRFFNPLKVYIQSLILYSAKILYSESYFILRGFFQSAKCLYSESYFILRDFLQLRGFLIVKLHGNFENRLESPNFRVPYRDLYFFLDFRWNPEKILIPPLQFSAKIRKMHGSLL